MKIYGEGIANKSESDEILDVYFQNAYQHKILIERRSDWSFDNMDFILSCCQKVGLIFRN